MAVVPEMETDLLEEQRLASLAVAAPHLEGYEIVELIGSGSYGDVWKARETQSGVVAAIKRLRRQPDAQACSEVEKLARLSAARGIVALRKVHLDAEPYCYVMEHLSGGTLNDLLRSRGQLTFNEAWPIFKQLVEALGYVHKDGIVHCDIKPDNVLFDAQGKPRLGDFGQARGKGPRGSSLGTRFYMPPEQARIAESVPDPRWDVYALGAILYEMLTGVKPRFNPQVAESPSAAYRTGSEIRDELEKYARHLETGPSPISHRRAPLDSSVKDLIDKCLTLDFDQRPQDAAAVLKLIERSDHSRHSRPLLVFGGLAPAVLFLLVGLFVVWGGWSTLAYVEDQWTTSMIESNRAIAIPIADGIAAQFNERARIVQKRALQVEHWDELLQEREPAALRDALAQLYGEDSKMFRRWSLADDRGYLLANFGLSEGETLPGVDQGSIGSGGQPNNFAWRGWFNGREDCTESMHQPRSEDLQAFAQRADLPFFAQPMLRKGDQPYWAMPISHPLTRPNGERFGVLSGQIYYAEFMDWVCRFEEATGRRVVIVNDAYQVIYPVLMRDPSHRAVQKFPDCRHFRAALESTAEAPDDDARSNAVDVQGVVHDPLDPNRDYLAACEVARLENGQRLAVFVQHDQKEAMAPIAWLRTLLMLLATGMLALGAVFLGVNSYALYWTVGKQREAATHV